MQKWWDQGEIKLNSFAVPSVNLETNIDLFEGYPVIKFGIIVC